MADRMKADMSNVDQAGSAEVYVESIRQLQGQMEVFQKRTSDLLQATDGHRILDAGCGSGVNLIRLAKLVAPNGEVVGVDVSSQLLKEAQKNIARESLPIKVQSGDVRNLDFEEGSFDRVYAERLLQHLDQPSLVLRELRRVLRPGGRVVVLDADYDSLLIDCNDVEVATVVARRRADAAPNGRIGRQLRRMLLENGFGQVSAEGMMLCWTDYQLAMKSLDLLEIADQAVTDGELSAHRVENWKADLLKRRDKGSFFLSSAGFIVSGQKPN